MIIVVSATAPFIYGQIVSFAEKVPSYVAAIEAKAGPLLDFVASELNGQDKPGIGENAAQYAGTAVQWVAKALARVLGLSFRRIQFTSDLLPADIVGVSVFKQDQGEFDYTIKIFHF